MTSKSNLVGCGNPLLDISAAVTESFLEKYSLKPNNAIVAEEKHKPLYKELIEKYPVDFTAGGSVQNTLRACQWILQTPYRTVFFGCVGDDEYSKILLERASNDGVLVRYQYVTDAPTGRCAALINGTNRTLVADLGAAKRFSLSHLNEEKNWPFFENAKYFYVSGFFMVDSLESVLRVAEHAEKQNSCFGFNLSAIFVSKYYMPAIRQVLPYVDILFGNGQEADAFALHEGWGITDRREIGKKLQSLEKKNCSRSRIIIITQDDMPVLLIQKDSVQEFEVPQLNVENLDTNGAGDCFVGGFFAQYILGKPLDCCIRCGIYVAHHTIGQSGVHFEGKPNFTG